MSNLNNMSCRNTANERTTELDNRIASRNVPSTSLQPSFGIRPVSTKYDFLPIYDKRQQSTVPIIRVPMYDVNTTFNPGSAQAPWSGFATNINNESILRNQVFAMQKSEQSKYIPSSNSDLYNTIVDGTNEHQPFPELFREQHLGDFNPNKLNVGNDLFNNSTRCQIKNL